jgi:hypothetical protein
MVDFSGSKLNRSISDDGEYVEAVLRAAYDYDAFTKFKQDPRYTRILEHVSVQQGERFLEAILTDSPDLVIRINDFKKNDLEGGATPHPYQGIGEISPSTLRYLKVASDLRKLFGVIEFGNVAEIGGGYGGQLLIIDAIFKFERYHLLDLAPVLKLVSRYLECHVLNNSYQAYTLNRHDGLVNYDLAISNYAFSELPSTVQIKYIEKILAKSKRGYLTMNSGLPNSVFRDDKLTLSELKARLPKFETFEERPLTGANNYIIAWGFN